jgi:uncharacterized protein (DUF1015 family)
MEIRPFKAYRFNKAVVGNAGDCIAPPYDIISTAEQEQLYKKNEYNIVRITKGKTSVRDNESDNQYTRAADYFNEWINKGVLKQDSDENIYAYVQDFHLFGKNFQRSSFIALGRLEEFGKVVRPHEQTLDKPKIDRLNLLRATQAQFGLVFMLYEDQRKIADKILENAARQKPLIDFIDGYNARHQLFQVTAADEIEAITEMMADKSCIIADGHHRYETALRYSKETSKPTAKYNVFAFVNTCNEGLVVLATHRLVSGLKGFEIGKLLAGLKTNFDVTELNFDSPQAKTDARQRMLTLIKVKQEDAKNAFGIYSGGSTFYVAVLKNKHAMDSAAQDESRAWKALDVSVLHKLVLEKLLGIDEKKLASEANIEYIKDTATALDDSIGRVDNGEKQAAFFMNPPKIEQMQMVADEGERMPQKSTYFYPKVYTGLTIYKL